MHKKPNTSDYLAFVYGVGIPEANFPSTAGTATGGDVNTLTDSTATWTINQWAGYVVQDQSQLCDPVFIASNTANTLTFSEPMALPVLAGDKYLIASQWLFTSYTVALETVNVILNVGSSNLYVLALYNLGVDRLINFATDVSDQTYFMDLRKKMNITTVSLGVTSGSSDGQTSQQWLNPEFMKNLTIGDLQLLKTVYGRAYMDIAQNFGQTLWGIS